jgi:ribonuclease R
MVAFGKRSNRVLRLGDEYKIRVARASKAESIIDFGPVDYKPKKSDDKKMENKKKGRR